MSLMYLYLPLSLFVAHTFDTSSLCVAVSVANLAFFRLEMSFLKLKQPRLVSVK